MKFAYLPAVGVYDTRGKQVSRPVLVIEVTGKDDAIFEIPALVDSGADTTVANIEYAKQLGIELGEEREIRGVGPGKVKARVGELAFRIKQTDISIRVPAWFVDSENVTVLIGQEVFFDKFRVKFEKDHGIFEIVPKNS
ncbi:MAG: hypothetical protein COU10_01545 [Candidatus Harrisonbacteria bacterium CG10_big_fil_rev_8_21_14_0_10_45_28]|uniref:Peptidase A2 domain-containing protein n=1 Tax=Candidatus Harrisonbacteria bacterium CG10_big_fil_rev_8_21_14_0_10_45_28 TaxID=1974586 RepID=A0A2H0UNN0_9BACT|nr:MAG: hypothetical protein COU10_01545 [Candidatus Harrisonbacteria bacterium CG10_big_fil_rev_8_21_14_0_10_45_28]